MAVALGSRHSLESRCCAHDRHVACFSFCQDNHPVTCKPEVWDRNYKHITQQPAFSFGTSQYERAQLVLFGTPRWNMTAAYVVLTGMKQHTWDLAVKPRLLLYLDHHKEPYENPFPVDEQQWWQMSADAQRDLMNQTIALSFISLQDFCLASGKLPPLPVSKEMQRNRRYCGISISPELAEFESGTQRPLSTTSTRHREIQGCGNEAVADFFDMAHEWRNKQRKHARQFMPLFILSMQKSQSPLISALDHHAQLATFQRIFDGIIPDTPL